MCVCVCVCVQLRVKQRLRVCVSQGKNMHAARPVLHTCAAHYSNAIGSRQKPRARLHAPRSDRANIFPVVNT